MPSLLRSFSRVMLYAAAALLLQQTACLSLPEQSCIDGIKNYNEEAVDCGGDCPYCPSCEDGVKNGQETAIDCGGPQCIECHECNDGLKNGDETGIDCGGAKCPPCSCTNSELDAGETLIDCGGVCPDCSATACSINDGYITVEHRNGLFDQGYFTTRIGTINPTFSSMAFVTYANNYQYTLELYLSGNSPTTPNYAQYRFPVYHPGTVSANPYFESTLYVNNKAYFAVPASGFIKVQYSNKTANFSSCGLQFSRNTDTVIVNFSQSL